jgi:hypothetical protein
VEGDKSNLNCSSSSGICFPQGEEEEEEEEESETDTETETETTTDRRETHPRT